MKITPLNNYPQYSKTKPHPKNNEVNFGGFDKKDKKAIELIKQMGLDPDDDLVQMSEFTFYSAQDKDGNWVLKGRPNLENLFWRHPSDVRYYNLTNSKDVDEMLKRHDGVMFDKSFVEYYLGMFNAFFYPNRGDASDDRRVGDDLVRFLV